MAGQQNKSMSYADRAKMNVRYDQKLKRNVLEIELHKDDNEVEVIITEETIVKLLAKINMDIVSHIEGYQVSHGRKKSKIEILCKAGLDLEQFCSHEIMEVEKGVRTNFIRPAGRKEVEVTVAGLGFNTPDSLVQEYISKFGGKLVKKDVIYEKYSSGPFNGKLNGIRKYRVDFTESKIEMGTFHVLDGSKVKVFYRGNRSTCGWCHSNVTKCPGGAKAKLCKEKDTTQVFLVDHMKELWNSIEFDPTTFELKEVEYDDTEDFSVSAPGDKKIVKATNVPKTADRSNVNENRRDIENFSVVKIKNFPPDMNDDEIVTFLKAEVDKAISIDHIRSERTDNNSTNVYLGPEPGLLTIAKAVEFLDYKSRKKIFFEDRRLYVQLHRPTAPHKEKIKSIEELNAESCDFSDKNKKKKARKVIQSPTLRLKDQNVKPN